MPSLQLDPSITAGPELGRVLINLASDAGHCVRTMKADPHESIHRLRITMKKLRSGLFLGRAELPASGVSDILETVVFLKNSVSAHRDQEVLRRCITHLALEIEKEKSLPGFVQCVAADLYPVYFPSIQEVEDALIASLAGKAHQLRRLLECLPFWVVTRRGLGETLEFTHAKVLRWRKVCRKSGNAEDFHEWRKAVKHQATQCLMLEKLFPGAGSYRKQAEALCESLGTMNDLENLRHLLLGKPVNSTCLQPILERIDEHLTFHHKQALRLARRLR